MPSRISCSILAAAALLAAAGCGPGKLSENKTFSLDPGETKSFILPVQTKPQKVTAEVDSANEVDVFIVEANKAASFENLAAGKQAEAAMASKPGVKAGSVAADVPAGAEVAVVVANARKKGTVKLLITNQK